MELNSEKIFNSSLLHSASRWIIAYSGGVDSYVLLHLAHQASKTFHKELLAIHINHGLHRQAKKWSEHCKLVCERLQIPYYLIQITVSQEAGISIEAEARKARYQAFANFVKSGDVLLTAHHQDDQAETFLLQLIRGAGVKGLASIAKENKFKTAFIARPLLEVSRRNIVDYAHTHQLNWIHDESNDNTRFDRNFLRHEIFPLLTQRWLEINKTLARAARHCSEADELLMERGYSDYQAAFSIKKINIPDFLETGIISRLTVYNLLKLSEARQANAIRAWLSDLKIELPSETQLAHLLKDVLHSDEDAEPILHWNKIEIRRFQGEIYLLHALPPFDATKIYPWDLKSKLILPIGCLNPKLIKNIFTASKKFSIRFRQGGERFHPSNRKHSQSLKKLFQEWGVPPWLRDRIPLLYSDEELLSVLGYAIKVK